MASNQLQYALLPSPECYDEYMKFLDAAVKLAAKQKKKKKVQVVLYIAGGQKIHASTLSKVVSKVEEQENLRVIYYFRDNEFEKIISAANGESKAKRDVEKGSAVERETLKQYFSGGRNHEVRFSYCGQDLYFHTKWVAFHPDSISDSDEVQILLTSANLTFDHLKSTRQHLDTTESRIVNSILRFTLSHKEFRTQFDKPMNSGLVLCRPVRFGTDPRGRLTQNQPPGNYNDVEVFSQVKHFVGEAIADNSTSIKNVELIIVSPFFSDELIIESILSQTQAARTKLDLVVKVVIAKPSKGRHVGLGCLQEDISAINDAKTLLSKRCTGEDRSSQEDFDKVICRADGIINKHKSGLPSTRNLQRLHDTKGSGINSNYETVLDQAKKELSDTDWTKNVEFYESANSFHCKFLAYGDHDVSSGKQQVLIMSANVDSKHMSGYSKKKNPNFHNLDWTYRLTMNHENIHGPLSPYDRIILEKRFGNQSQSN